MLFAWIAYKYLLLMLIYINYTFVWDNTIYFLHNTIICCNICKNALNKSTFNSDSDSVSYSI